MLSVISAPKEIGGLFVTTQKKAENSKMAVNFQIFKSCKLQIKNLSIIGKAGI
jgi:hypothetical protein